MYFKTSGRINPATQQYDSYYRLVESYRNAEGRVCHRTILNVGFLNAELTIDQVNLISRTLTDKYQHKVSLFPINDPLVARWVVDLWARIVADNRLDLTLYDPKSRMIDADTLTQLSPRRAPMRTGRLRACQPRDRVRVHWGVREYPSTPPQSPLDARARKSFLSIFTS